jgi:biuret amidohydrolase
MIMQLRKNQRRHILIDIDTQKDFLSAWGSARIINRRQVLTRIRRVISWVRVNNIPVISTAEVYPSLFHPGITHCIDGTEGQHKISYTLLNNRISFPADTWNALPGDLLKRHQQVILHKRCIDPFEEPSLERLLSEVRADEFILIGCYTEQAIETTALGLLQRGRRVVVVADAVGSCDEKMANLALRKIAAKGAEIVSACDIAGFSRLADLTTIQHERFSRTGSTLTNCFSPGLYLAYNHSRG